MNRFYKSQPAKMSRLHCYIVIVITLFCAEKASGGLTDTLIVNETYSRKVISVRSLGLEASDSVGFLSQSPLQLDLLNPEGLLPGSNDSLQYYIDLVTAVNKKVKQTQNKIDKLNNTTGINLPVSIGKEIAGLNYDIEIYAVRLKPSYTEIDVSMSFVIPQNGETLSFMSKSIKLSKAGGIIGDAKLVLLGDYAINFNGNKGQLILKGGYGGTGSTFVRMDCDGFREMSLDAQVLFSRDLLLPEDGTGNIKLGNVVASFQAVISSWNDLLVQLSLPNFQVAGLNGFGFSITDAVFDFSDTRNAPNVIFPQGYRIDNDPALTNLWRGIYLRRLSVRLPTQFKNNQATTTLLAATNLLIDNQGVSGLFTGTQLIPLSGGNMSGWAFSVDSLGVSLLANQIQKAGFKGSIVVPIADQQSPFRYTASFGANDQYLFDITSSKNMRFDLFQASQVEIDAGSSLEIKLDNGRFLPKAILNGKMNIEVKLSDAGQGVKLADIKFQKLQIQSIPPYIQVGVFSFGSQASQQVLAGFPISISDIGLKQITGDQVGLSFKLKLNLADETSGAFAADGGLIIVGQLNKSNEIQSWSYKDLQVQDIDIDIDAGEAFQFSGSLSFYKQDPVFGDGFNGAVAATIIKVDVEASAIFGNINGKRYWYVDALTFFNPGFPVAGNIGVFGFGVGVCHRMAVNTGKSQSPLGQTASGVSYVPALDRGLELKGIVYIGTLPDERAFVADVTLTVSFFETGGVRKIVLTGDAFIATPNGLGANIDQLKSTFGKMVNNASMLEASTMSNNSDLLSKITNSQVSTVKSIQGDIGSAAGDKGGISAFVYIGYDFENRTLYGNFDVQIDVASGLIKGGGDAVLKFSPTEWYVYIGTPDQRFSISVGVGPIRATASTYLMVGSTIPGSPPPPAEVSQILGGVNLDYMKDLNAISRGAGFAFGASLSFNTGNLSFLIFYARFDAGAGFDIMIKNYGNTYCEGSNDRIGINGWYANGQAYAYFEGEIGIHIKVFGIKKNIQILSIGAAAVLQAKLPNPIWLQGTVGGYFSVLGGLASGQCSFQVTLGNDCKLIQKSDDSALNNIAVVSQLTPAVGESKVNVFTNPQAVFNLAIGKQFSLDEGSNPQPYRIKLDTFTLITTDGASLKGSLVWNDTRTVAAFNTFDVMPPQKQITSSVKVSFEKLVNGSWIKVLDNGKPITEQQSVTFTTGDAPDYIPLSNIEYSYPVVGQLNFYKNENNAGYIKLKKGQSYLFNPGSDWVQQGRFSTTDGTAVQYNFTYANAIINFNIPVDKLKNEQIYSFQLVNVPAAKTGTIDRNVSQVTNEIKVSGQSTSTEIKTQQAQGSITQLQEKSIFSAYFRSSKYSTLASKVAVQNLATTFPFLRILWRVHSLETNFSTDEPFDQAELTGNSFTGNTPLIMPVADLSDNDYYNNEIYPLIYQNYPIDGDIKISSRDATTLGLPPVRAVSVIQSPSDLSLDQDNPTYEITSSTQSYSYDLPIYMYSDLWDIQPQVANRYLNRTSTTKQIQLILWEQFPIISIGNYKINLPYVLPGQSRANSVQQVVLYNSFGYR